MFIMGMLSDVILFRNLVVFFVVFVKCDKKFLMCLGLLLGLKGSNIGVKFSVFINDM